MVSVTRGSLLAAALVLVLVSWTTAVDGARQGASFVVPYGQVAVEGQREWNVTRALELHAAEGPHDYPLYKQCDSRWGSDVIVSKTVCQVGCLMSSISMGLAGWQISIDGSASNPGTLNSWLLDNSGYTQGNNLIEDALNAIVPGMWSGSGMHKSNDLDPQELPSYFDNSIVVANVMNGRHFVLATGWDPEEPDNVYVNDPGFRNTQYSFSEDIVGWRIFTMT